MMYLKSRFLELGERLGVTGDKARLEYEKLNKIYSDKERHYHNFFYIEYALHELDKLDDADLLENTDAVETAIWYRYVAYTPVSDNEMLAAMRFAKACSSGNISMKFCDYVTDIIISLRPQAKMRNEDAKYFHDIEVSLFGRPWREYNSYRELIRYDRPKALGKCDIQNLLNRDSLYMTDFFRERYEHAARDNLKRTLRAILKDEMSNGA